MDALVQYILPISGLQDGMHQFEFEIDDQFFAHFENSPIQHAQLQLTLYFDKRPSMFVMTFDFSGLVRVACDRCLDEFMLPLEGSESMVVKFREQASEEGDVVYIPRNTLELDVSKYVYDYLCLALPVSKTHEEAGLPCDEDVIRHLNQKTEESEKTNPVWDVLKDINKNSLHSK